MDVLKIKNECAGLMRKRGLKITNSTLPTVFHPFSVPIPPTSINHFSFQKKIQKLVQIGTSAEILVNRVVPVKLVQTNHCILWISNHNYIFSFLRKNFLRRQMSRQMMFEKSRAVSHQFHSFIAKCSRRWRLKFQIRKKHS